MKLLFLLGSSAAAAALASAQQCADQKSANHRFDDPSPLAKHRAESVDDCCNTCAQNTECKAWTFEPAGLLRSPQCFLHSSTSLPKEQISHYTCAVHDPQPAPSPSPPPIPGKAQNWVVIAAGSKTYGNYRHQADACHAYQVVKKGGVPESNIILMMEDDIANDAENPFPGKMFNKPTKEGVQGVDVYDGCKIDYRGSVVTAKLFLDVLQGKQDAVAGVEGSGKVLKSGPNDKVFINFADHGGTGIIEFPNGDFLHATDLNDALKTMHQNKMYKKLVFYMEACESGSMFKDLLPTDINIFATTAANAEESSWGTYCPPDDLVDGKSLNSCLGDLYSVNWMEDADTSTGRARTLANQYEYLVQVTNKSHVSEFGTVAFSKTDHVKDYVAPKENAAEDAAEDAASDTDFQRRPVDTHDVELLQDFYKYFRAEEQGKTAEEKQALADNLVAVVQSRQQADARFGGLDDIVAQFDADFDATGTLDADCVKTAYTAFKDSCGAFDSYSLKYTHQVAELCYSYSADSIQQIIDTMCQ